VTSGRNVAAASLMAFGQPHDKVNVRQRQPRSNKISNAVPTIEMAIDPAQPNRFEKNKNTPMSLG
jgi:hypothetical protein